MEYKKTTGLLDASYKPDRETLVLHLREMIGCRTISETAYYRKEEFDKFNAVLKKNYPTAYHMSEKIELNNSTFLRIPGKDSHSPLVLMSHKDVVFEGKKKWKAPPYKGKILKGKMFGRGTFDCKASLCCLMEAVESLLREGYDLNTDLYIFASASEETGGNDAPTAVEYFKSNGIVPGLVVDEGGAILKNPFPSSVKRFAMVGAVERSSGKMLFDAPDTEKADLFRKKLKKFLPGDTFITPEVSELMKGLSEYLYFPFGTIVGLLDRHHKAAAFILSHCGPDARSFCAASLRTAVPTEKEKEDLQKTFGSLKAPVQVSVSGNYYNKIERLTEEVAQKADKSGMKLITKSVRETEPPISTSSAGYRFTTDVAKLVFNKTAALPYPVLGRTDARYFIGTAEDVIRFIPVEISLSQMMKFHCPNENIFIESLPGAVKFYRELIIQYMKN